MALVIRGLIAGDEALLRATRLRALADAPAAFGMTLAAAQARDDEIWTNQAAGRLGTAPCVTWVAVDADGDGVGMLTGVDTGDAVDVIQVWVAPDHRGTGLVERGCRALWAGSSGSIARQRTSTTSGSSARMMSGTSTVSSSVGSTRHENRATPTTGGWSRFSAYPRES